MQPAAVSVPMTTTVASCAGCGADGADRVTLTVPFLVVAVPGTGAGAGAGTATTGYWPTGSVTGAAATPPATGRPTPSMVSVSAGASVAEVNFGWAVGLGVAIAVVRFALMFF